MIEREERGKEERDRDRKSDGQCRQEKRERKSKKERKRKKRIEKKREKWEGRAAALLENCKFAVEKLRRKNPFDAIFASNYRKLDANVKNR